MSTIVDVAKLAGVSTGTVSNYISGTRPVSLKKQKAIIDAMMALKYEPNISARVLKSKKNNLIGLILPNILDAYYSRILCGVQSYLADHAYGLMISVSNNDPVTESKAVADMVHNQVSGLIIVSCQPSAGEFYKSKILEQKIPVVFLDRKVNGLPATFLGCDNQKSTCEITRRLIASGKKKIAFLGGNPDFSDQEDAFCGYYNALQDSALFSQALVSRKATDKESAFTQMLGILDRALPDAVIAADESIGYGIKEALRFFSAELAEQIPVCILGVDTWDSAGTETFALKANRYAISLGSTAAELICEQIKNPVTAEISSHMIPCDVKADHQDVTFRKASLPQSIRLLMVRMTSTQSLEQMLPAFENSSGIHVDVEIIDHADYSSYLSQCLKSGSVPDVVLVDMPWLPVFANQGLLCDLTGAIDTYGIDTSIYVKGCMDYLCRYQGRTYGLPLVYTPQVLFYRNDLFSDRRLQNAYEQSTGSKLRAPRSWQEFSAVANFFTRKYNPQSPTKYGVSLPCGHPEGMSTEIRMRMRAYGGEICDKNGKVIFESQENLNAFSQLVDTLRFCPPDFCQKDRSGIVQDYIGGQAAMIVNFHPILNEVIAYNLHHYLGVAPVPGFQAILGGWCLCIPKNAQKFDQAMRFISWVSSQPTSGKLMVLSAQAVVAEVLDSDELHHRNRWFRSWREAYQTAQPNRPDFDHQKRIVPNNETDWILYQVVQKIIAQQMSVADALHWGQLMYEALFSVYENGPVSLDMEKFILGSG